MMVELTDDAALIAPVGMACIIAMVIGNHFNHGLYHGLIHTFSMPFINAAPSVSPRATVARMHAQAQCRAHVRPRLSSKFQVLTLIACVHRS
jgi:hypothetical protein